MLQQYIPPPGGGLLGGALGGAGLIQPDALMASGGLFPPSSPAGPAEQALLEHIRSGKHRLYWRPDIAKSPVVMLTNACCELQQVRAERDRARHECNQLYQAQKGVPVVEVHFYGAPTSVTPRRADTVEEYSDKLILTLDGKIVASFDRNSVRGWTQTSGREITVVQRG